MTQKQSDRPAYKRMHKRMKEETMPYDEFKNDADWWLRHRMFNSLESAERAEMAKCTARCELIDRMTLDARAAMQGYLSSGAINKEPHHVAAVAWGHAREMAAMRAKVIKEMEG